MGGSGVIRGRVDGVRLLQEEGMYRESIGFTKA